MQDPSPILANWPYFTQSLEVQQFALKNHLHPDLHPFQGLLIRWFYYPNIVLLGFSFTCLGMIINL